jgi:hypothetical protein
VQNISLFFIKIGMDISLSLPDQINKKSPFPSGKGLIGRIVPMGISHIRCKIILHAAFISVKRLVKPHGYSKVRKKGW